MLQFLAFNPMNGFPLRPSAAAVARPIVTAMMLFSAVLVHSDGLSDKLMAEIGRNRKLLGTVAKSDFTDGERPRFIAQLADAETFLKAGRVSACIEAMASTVPGMSALLSAGSGWDDSGKGTGKHIEDLTKEWEAVGRVIASGRPRFPAVAAKGQSLFVRATAEQVFGQIDEHYAVALEFGRVSGVTEGAYYLGRAQGQLEFALFLGGLTSQDPGPARAVPALEGSLTKLEDDIVAAYAKPGSTAQHSSFIVANSSLKLAKELNQRGLRNGALLSLLRGLLALNLATLNAPRTDQEPALAARMALFQKRFADAKFDNTIGLALVEKAAIALGKAGASGEAGDRERLRAFAIVDAVLPRYVELMEASSK